MAAPTLSAPARSKPRPGRPSASMSTILAPPPSSVADSSLGDITLDLSSKETTRENEDLTPTNQSTPLPKITTKTAPPPPPPVSKVTAPTPTDQLTEPIKLDNFKVFITLTK